MMAGADSRRRRAMPSPITAARSTSRRASRPTRRSRGSTSRPGSTRTPIPCPIFRPRSGRGCPTARRSPASRRAAARALRRPAGSGRRRPGIAGAPAGAGAAHAPRRGRRARPDLRRLRRRLRASGRPRSSETDSLDALAACDVAIVANPNNPDGRIVAPGATPRPARAARTRGGLLIVDEAFRDFDADASLAPLLPERARSCCARSARLSASRA